MGFIFDKGSKQYRKNPNVIKSSTETTTNKSKDKNTNIEESIMKKTDMNDNDEGVVPFNNSVLMRDAKKINSHKIGYILFKFNTLEEIIRIRRLEYSY